MRATLRFLLFTFTFLWAVFGLGGGCGSSASLSTISISPPSASLVVGGAEQLSASGTYSDGAVKDISDQVAWSSSDAGVLTVDAKGLVTGVAAGHATVTATLEGISASTALTVAPGDAPVSIAVTPAAPTIAKGTAQQMVATGTYKDSSTKDITGVVAWSSSDTKAVTFAGAQGMEGVATGVDLGTAKLTATLGGVSGSATATVTDATLVAIDVGSTDAYVAKGLTEQFRATGVFSDDTRQDLTKQVAWASSSAAVSISTVGLATANAEGSVTITATMMGVTGSRWFWVTSATLSSIAVSPADPSIAKGTTVALRASGILSDHSVVDVTGQAQWSSATESVVTVATDEIFRGIAAGVSPGAAVVTATYGGKSGSTTVTVTPATLSKVSLLPQNPTLPKGAGLSFTVIGTFSDATSQDLTSLATWGSSDIGVAKISNTSVSRGVASAVGQGHATITATFGGKSDSTTLTVSPAVLASIAVTPANPSIAKGTSVQLSAVGTYSDRTVYDLTSMVIWNSDDPSVGIAGPAPGVATGVNVGKARVTATIGGVAGSTTVTVTAATLTSIMVTPTNRAIAKGTTLQLFATGIFSDQSALDLTRWVSWDSSDASVAVSNAWATHGLVLGQVEGTAKVTATFLGGVSGSTFVHVTSATLVSMEISPHDPTIAKGTSVWLSAVGTYTDNSKQDLTTQVAWDTSDAGVVSVGNPILPGLATGQTEGSATVTASFAGKSAATTVTVTPASLVSLSVQPSGATLAKGTTGWLTATARYSDNSTQDLTQFVAWSSSDTTVALISNVEGSRGLVTAVSPGSVTISADIAGKTGTTQLTVSAAVLASISIAPSDASVDVGGTLQFNATGKFTDNSTQDITTIVFWSTDDPQIALASNAAGSRGLVTGVAAGTTTLNARLAGLLGTTGITVQ